MVTRRPSRSLPDFVRMLKVSCAQHRSIVALDFNLDPSTDRKLVASHRASVAQWERELICLLAKQALAAAKTKGVKVARPGTQSRRCAPRSQPRRDLPSYGRPTQRGFCAIARGRHEWPPNSSAAFSRGVGSDRQALQRFIV